MYDNNITYDVLETMNSFLFIISYEGIGQWPPKMSTEIPLLAELDTNPVVRRNVCMTMGRLNSQILNSSSELSKYYVKIFQ